MNMLHHIKSVGHPLIIQTSLNQVKLGKKLNANSFLRSHDFRYYKPVENIARLEENVQKLHKMFNDFHKND